MKLYILVTTFAHDYPEATRPKVYTDREQAAAVWAKEVLEDGEGIDPDVIQALAVDWANDETDSMPLEWIVGGEGPLNEMHQVQLFTVVLS